MVSPRRKGLSFLWYPQILVIAGTELKKNKIEGEKLWTPSLYSNYIWNLVEFHRTSERQFHFLYHLEQTFKVSSSEVQLFSQTSLAQFHREQIYSHLHKTRWIIYWMSTMCIRKYKLEIRVWGPLVGRGRWFPRLLLHKYAPCPESASCALKIFHVSYFLQHALIHPYHMSSFHYPAGHNCY